MIVQPVLPAALVVIVALAVAGLAVWRAVASRGSSRLVWIGRVALVLACGLLLLRPGISGGAAETLAAEVDVVIVVDATASIVAEDWDGDEPRLDGVRADVEQIVARYPGARFALLTFDSDAVVRVPLTTDAAAVVSSISVLRPEVTSRSQGSSVGVAAGLLEQTLGAAADLAPERSRLVFYLGDGEQTSSGFVESFEGSADLVGGGAVLGYGTEAGGPMRQTDAGLGGPGGYILYEGDEALSVIDPANLQQIAADLGVDYQQRAAGDALGLPGVPATATAPADGTTGTVTELTWVVALVIAALLALELARATTALVEAARVAPRAARKDAS
ncbi:VWA domain-containing protein [Pseudolysinimonas sp.]|jgi:Ca-activated chloride channel family protein|uniref:VWA domain-containing protein n=1 Tax=Pseudolysinimonas sp. TaxID=2680009 RepID=UPI0037833C88